MSVNLIIQEFLKTNPRKRFPDKSWKVCNPEKYQSVILDLQKRILLFGDELTKEELKEIDDK